MPGACHLSDKTAPTDLCVDNACYKSWWTYHGLLVDAQQRDVAAGSSMHTRLYGFETFSDPSASHVRIPEGGAVFGFVVEGRALLGRSKHDERHVDLRAGQWFAMPDAVQLQLAPETRVMAVQSVGFVGLAALGGPIEQAGRLRYIDRCSDTLLMGPPLLGDPCLNHLHFPPGISQTTHTHPSGRFGTVARGQGVCETPLGRSILRRGVVFYIPDGAQHHFVTQDEGMDVIAFHPDSDWGPTDRDHPMINRTLVDGRKMDNSIAQHQHAEVAVRCSA